MIDYFLANLKKEKEREILTDYITECLRMINTSISKRLNGEYIKKPFREVKRASFKPPEKTSARKIIADVTKKAGLVVTD